MWDWVHLGDNTGVEGKKRGRGDVKNSRKKKIIIYFHKDLNCWNQNVS